MREWKPRRVNDWQLHLGYGRAAKPYISRGRYSLDQLNAFLATLTNHHTRNRWYEWIRCAWYDGEHVAGLRMDSRTS